MEENKPVNPYQAPSATTVAAPPQAEGEVNFIPNGRGVAAGRGWDWISSGWGLFTAAPMIWILDIIILFAINFALGLIPFLGHVATNLLYPIFGAGLMISAHSAARSSPPEVAQLFAGFKEKGGSLVVVGALYVVGTVIILAIVGALALMLLGMSGLFTALFTGDSAKLVAMFGTFSLSLILLILVWMALYAPLMAALWFAPALVVFHNVAPLDAMKMSFAACMKNIVPFLIYGLVFIVLFVVGAIPLGLGLLVVIPLMITSTYTSYRDIFVGDAA
jgi:uncharacterized membrane protein